MTQLIKTENDQVEEEISLSQLSKTIIIHRLCADSKPPHGKTVPKEVVLPDITIENEFTDESSNDQTTDEHKEETAHHRRNIKTIGRKRTHDCSAFVTDKNGEFDKQMLTELVEDKLFGAFKNIVPSYLNASGQDEIMSQSRISFAIEDIGKVEETPESQMVQTNGMTKGTIWRYAEVLTFVKGRVTFTSTKLKPKKLREYADKTLFQRIGTFHNVNQRIGTIEIVD